MNIVKIYRKSGHGTELIDQGFPVSATLIKNGYVKITSDTGARVKSREYQPTTENGLYWKEYGCDDSGKWGALFDSRTGEEVETNHPLPGWFTNPNAEIPHITHTMDRDGSVKEHFHGYYK